MLTQFDYELYPDDCEVVEIPLHNQFVYLIQKNGSTSLRNDIKEQNLRIIRNQDIKNLSNVDVYIRSPFERYLSGVNTYIQHLQRDNPQLDQYTCMWFATQYNFLNRHYLSQFLWIANLSRYINADCNITLRKFSEISIITKHKKRAGISPATEEFNKQIKSMINSNLQLWMFLDQMLEDMCGTSLTFDEIIKKVKSHPSGCYQILTSRFIEVAKKITVS
jgi:hypothetical protein